MVSQGGGTKSGYSGFLMAKLEMRKEVLLGECACARFAFKPRRAGLVAGSPLRVGRGLAPLRHAGGSVWRAVAGATPAELGRLGP